jgi:adenylyltransferase/sulfurtransferase
MIYDALEMQYRRVNIRKDPNCALCGPNPTVTELIDYDAFCGNISDEAAEAAAGSTISATDLKGLLDKREAGDTDFMLIDVREPGEYEIVNIPGAVLIPKGRFLDGSVLAELPTTKPIILHCKSGVRSAECLAVLKGAGFADARHVGGGVLAWVNQIEPEKPTY